ncbi:FMN-binding negative transcriptional regulator [Pseudoroseicyclus tamaricis]|uniref:FMN-binding negative transcriptional regulator n=1 Tax=Pseudoroseicyclus tamaricis TaxID=2705421 RepID=A0A6B2K2E5_9RHOB|nr:FMN-binding negative transcriptional regulator [Pseudoroseicyclus tamaricis]NDV02724.1 FMN-binding negative transcriptional regulator [Pseudoroseicyclus tamaricis]
MHPNKAFHTRSAAANLAFAAGRGFGTLAVVAEAAPLLSHIPFVLLEEGLIEAHLVRSNPIARALLAGPLQARLAVTGPEGYVSPDWYGLEDQVPTWNYVAVHLAGPLELRPAEELRGHLDRLSAEFEARLAPKPPWLAAKMPPDLLARMMRSIVPVRLRIEAVDGTWKLGQNKPEAARLAAAAHVGGALGELMQTPPED